MSADNSEQLLARAILDLELKIKHEIRQHSALHLAKMDKHKEDINKRLGIIEAKLEAIISRDHPGHAHRNSNSSYFPGGSRAHPPNASANATGRVSYYARTPMANGHSRHMGGGRSASRLHAVPGAGSPLPGGGVWSPNALAVRSHNQPHHSDSAQPPHQPHRHTYKREQYQSKQPLGTGSNRTNLGEKQLVNGWTVRNFADVTDEDSADGDNSSQTGSESPYSVAKPACQQQEDDGGKEESEEAEEEEVTEENGSKKALEDEEEIVVEENASKKLVVEDEEVVVVERNTPVKVVVEEEEVVVEESTPKKAVDMVEEVNENDSKKTLDAAGPLAGGFGRGRRN